MEGDVGPFNSGREGLFGEHTHINCSIAEFCACEGANNLFDIEEVMRQKHIDLGEGIMISEPLNVDRWLLTGGDIFASLSHQGILAICAYSGGNNIQFTNLYSSMQVEMDIEDNSLVGFYDNMALLLTEGRPLREGTVKSIFENPSIERFREIEGTNNVNPLTDVSLLHVRRILYYPTKDQKLFSFNADTRAITEINIGKNVVSIASFTGINCGVQTVFGSDDIHTYTLNMNNIVTKVNDGRLCFLRTIFPSASNANNITNAVFKHLCVLKKNDKDIDTSNIIKFNGNSVIRVYKDIFLTYEERTNSWVLFRLIIS